MGKGAVVVGTILGFLGGAAGGIFGARFYFKQMYEQKAEEEIASVRNAFANAKHIERKEDTAAEQKTIPISNKEQLSKAATAHSAYTGGTTTTANSETYLNTQLPKRPYMIAAEDYRALEDRGYVHRELKYYVDGVIVDSATDGVMAADAVSALVGNMWRDEMTEDDEEIYIRNEGLKADIAITRVLQRYSNLK